MGPGRQGTTAVLDSLVPGTHLCAFHRDDDEQTRVAATFIGQGLSDGDQLMYVGTDDQVHALLRALPDEVDARSALAVGQLLVTSFADAYGTRRPGDLTTVADGFRAAAELSRTRGFAGLRVAAQMDGLVPLLGSSEEVVRWERMSTGLQREIGVSSVCLYDASRLDEELLDLLAGEHSGFSPQVSPTPQARFLALEHPWGLRISGEVDLANRELLRRMLLARGAVLPQLHVDLTGLAFADVGSVSILRSVAAELPDDGWLVLSGVPDGVRRILAVTGLGHERLRFAS
ncbi:MEDS domain-containing protein [Nocardioides currus]|nr:MEDS domain-containing protein [Nocardioides currus]